MRKYWLVLALSALCALTACIHVNLSGQPWVYVASGATPALTAYSIAPDGALAPAACAPLDASGMHALAGAGAALFASVWQLNAIHSDVAAYSIANNGCLTLQSTTDTTRQGAPATLFIDPQRQSLYSWAWRDTTTATLSSYSIASTGALQYTGSTYAGYPTYFGVKPFIGPIAGGMLAFSPDDTFAVTASFYGQSTSIAAFKRAADGSLQPAKNTANSPADPGHIFLPIGAASSNDGHFVIAGVFCFPSSLCNSPIQFAVYTLDDAGNLSTHDTRDSMVTPPSNGYIMGYAFSPDGRFFACASGGGLDIYRWDGAALHYLDSVTMEGDGFNGELLQSFAWDRYNHLVFTTADASIANSGTLQVYTVTESGAAPAPNSPHTLPNPTALAVVNVLPN